MVQRGKPPTLADVALRARVSHQTVSRVVNAMGGVRPETEARVREALDHLGYRQNLAARALASRRSGLIGAVVWASSQFGPQQVLISIDRAARAAGYQLAVRTVHDLNEVEVRVAVDQLLSHGVEAILLVMTHASATTFVDKAEHEVPMVMVAGDLSRAPRTVGMDNVTGARLATRHLLGLGHQTVVHLAGPPNWSEATARAEGWRLELQAHGREVPPLRWTGDWSAASGYAAGRTLAREPDITAVFVGNDQMALGVMSALSEAGRSVPDDVSVVGFDDVPEAAYFQPALTTVRQNFEELGRRSLKMVTDLLEGSADPVAELVVPELVVRLSTSRPGCLE